MENTCDQNKIVELFEKFEILKKTIENNSNKLKVDVANYCNITFGNIYRKNYQTCEDFVSNYKINSHVGTYLRHLIAVYTKIGVFKEFVIFSYRDEVQSLDGALWYANTLIQILEEL